MDLELFLQYNPVAHLEWRRVGMVGRQCDLERPGIEDLPRAFSQGLQQPSYSNPRISSYLPLIRSPSPHAASPRLSALYLYTFRGLQRSPVSTIALPHTNRVCMGKKQKLAVVVSFSVTSGTVSMIDAYRCNVPLGQCARLSFLWWHWRRGSPLLSVGSRGYVCKYIDASEDNCSIKSWLKNTHFTTGSVVGSVV